MWPMRDVKDACYKHASRPKARVAHETGSATRGGREACPRIFSTEAETSAEYFYRRARTGTLRGGAMRRLRGRLRRTGRLRGGVAKLSLREDMCTWANEDCCIATRQGPRSRLQSPGVAEWATRRGEPWGSSWDAPWGQPPVSTVPRPGRPPTRKPAQRQHRRPRVRSDVGTHSIHGGESGGVLPALGKERSFGDREDARP